MSLQRLHLIVLALITVVTILIVGIVATMRPIDPIYKGRKASVWVGRICNADRDDQALNITLEIGGPAVPFLMKAIRAQRSGLRHASWYSKCWASLPKAAQNRLPRPEPRGLRMP